LFQIKGKKKRRKARVGKEERKKERKEGRKDQPVSPYFANLCSKGFRY
jgi:hypothetical protein